MRRERKRDGFYATEHRFAPGDCAELRYYGGWPWNCAKKLQAAATLLTALGMECALQNGGSNYPYLLVSQIPDTVPDVADPQIADPITTSGAGGNAKRRKPRAQLADA